MVGGVCRGKYQRALQASPFNPDFLMNEYQHSVMIMNSLYIDEEQKDHEYEEFLEIKQFSHETVSAYIDRFEARKLQTQDLGLPQNDIITKKTFLDGLLKPIGVTHARTEEKKQPTRLFEQKGREGKRISCNTNCGLPKIYRGFVR